MWDQLMSFFRPSPLTDEAYQAKQKELLAKAPVPVLWLFGKTGSGKTTLIRHFTGAQDADIGTGFKPQTMFSRQYDFPSPEEPIMRFLDTRGLGEGRYDPKEDIEKFADAAHIILVTVRAMDHALAEIVEPLKAIRQARPQRPIMLVLTSLHEAYPGSQHPHPDPFEAGSPAEVQEALARAGRPESAEQEFTPGLVDLARSISLQEERFAGLVDRIVAIDITPPLEGFNDPNFGHTRLEKTLLELLPAAYREALVNYATLLRPLADLNERRALPYILGYSTLAATAGAVPIPWVDIPVVLAIQTHLLYRLAGIYGQELHAGTLRTMVAAVGGRLLMRLAMQEALKFIPWVGIPAGAAMAFGYTYGMGKACCWYFGEICAGNAPRPEDLERIWSEQLLQAARFWEHKSADKAGTSS